MTEKPTIYFIRNYKFILKEHGPVVSSFLGYLIDQDGLRRNTRKKYKGQFYLSRTQLAEETMIKRKGQISCEKILIKAKFITLETEDHNANKYTINYGAIEKKNPTKTEDEENTDSLNEVPPQVEGSSTSEDVPPQVGGSSISEEVPSPPPSRSPVPTQEGVNYIGTRSSSISVSRSGATDGAEAPKSTDSGNIKSSCIKEESVAKAPPRAAPTSTGDEIQDIVNEYNSAMQLPQASDDYAFVKSNLEDFRKIRKYLTPACIEYAWSHFSDEVAAKLKTKRLCVMKKFSVFDPFVKRHRELYSYFVDNWDNRLNKVFKYYRNMVNELVAPENLHVNIVGELAYPSNETADGKSYRKKRIQIYKQYIEPKLLKDEELEDLIIDMEVPEWIV